MSASVHILVEYKDGKPHLTLGRTPTVRGYTREGSANLYAKQIVEDESASNARRIAWGGQAKPLPDIRVLSITIPDEGPVGDGMWPNLIPELALRWS